MIKTLLQIKSRTLNIEKRFRLIVFGSLLSKPRVIMPGKKSRIWNKNKHSRKDLGNIDLWLKIAVGTRPNHNGL